MGNKMLLDKEEFLKSELGLKLQALVRKWDLALQQGGMRDPGKQEEIDRCLAQWEVYQLAMKQFYGLEYHFTRTDEYFGAVTEDEADWLIKVDREPASQDKAWTECCNDVDELEEAFIRRIQEYSLLLEASQKPDITCCTSHQEVEAAL